MDVLPLATYAVQSLMLLAFAAALYHVQYIYLLTTVLSNDRNQQPFSKTGKAALERCTAA